MNRGTIGGRAMEIITSLKSQSMNKKVQCPEVKGGIGIRGGNQFGTQIQQKITSYIGLETDDTAGSVERKSLENFKKINFERGNIFKEDFKKTRRKIKIKNPETFRDTSLPALE